MTNGVEIPTDFSAHSLAEYIEAISLIENIEHLSQAELRSRFPSGQQPSSQDISFGLAEIDRRSRELGRGYPYRQTDSGVVRDANELTAVYDFMTILSLESSPMRLTGEYSRSDPLFDAVVREASKAFLGPGSRALCFGWPPRDGRPANFVEAVSWVGAEIGIPDGVMDRPTEEKDAGVDVIAWKPFKDERTGFPVYLIQNTVRLDYANKPRDVVPGSWMQWLRFGTPPSVGFAIPFAVPRGDDRWVKINDSADLVLDRFRIIEKLPEGNSGDLREFEAIVVYNRQEIDGIRSDEAAPTGISRPRKQRKSEYRDVLVR